MYDDDWFYQIFMDNLELLRDNSTFDHLSDIAKRDPCHFEKHQWLEAKLILISICGTTVAILGILGNVTTTIVLTRPGMRSPNNLYLTFLAIFDTLLLLAAIILYSIEYIFEYLESLALYEFWIKFVRYGFALSHVAQTGSVYITVAVTFERYLAVLYPKRAKVMCTHDRSALTIALVIGFSILFNCTKYFEVEVVQNSNCTGFAAQRLVPSALLGNHLYQTVHSLWLTQMIMVFIPFIVLFFVNTAIVCKVRRSLKRLSWIQRGRKRNQLKEKSRDATKVLLVIVLVFLICNSWGFVLTLFENLYTEKKLREWWPVFYAFSREAVNFLAIVNSSINFVIYCIFGKDFRQELVSVWGCSGLVLMPAADRFTAESLIGSPDHRRPSMFLRYTNLIRQVQTQKDGERKSSNEASQEKRNSASANIRAMATALMSSRRSSPQKRASKQGHLNDVVDKNGRGSWNRATISSGDYNGDFVSIGKEETTIVATTDLEDQKPHANGFSNNTLSVPTSEPSTMPQWKRILLAKGCICTNPAMSASPSGDCQVTNESRSSIVGINLSPDAEPLAPFLLGMLVTSAPSMRQAGIESAMKNFEEDDIWV